MAAGVGDRFERRTVRLAPGQTLPFEPPSWADTLVAVRSGEIELETTSGARLALVSGDIGWLTGLSLRVLRNRGAEPVVLDTVSRRHTATDEFGAPDRSDPPTKREGSTMSASPGTISIDRLRRAARGRVIGPADPGYDGARTVFYGEIDKRPAAIVRVADERDVAAVVAFVREAGVELAIRSGGHSGAGHGTSDGGVVLDLGELRGMDVDSAARIARAQTGLTALEYARTAGEHGLVTGFGDTGSVGIGGITLGGGVGYLARRYGLTIDDLIAADVVTADGELLHVDEEAHPDLFWAIRGGGGNFGVATRFTLRLHGLPSVVGGMLLLPATAETVAAFLDAAERAPEELSAIANVMPAPPMPFLPEEHHGRLSIMALMCFAGEAGAGERVMAPFRAIAPPLADMVRPMAYPEIYPPDDEDYHPTAASTTMFVDDVDAASIRTMLEALETSSAMLRVVQIRPLGGAVARVANDATAFAHRDRRYMVNVAALYADPAEREGHRQWVESVSSAIQRGPVAAYVNFLLDEGEARVRAAYPGETWDRLRRVKAAYDPENVFRLNQNIPPATKD